MKNKKMFLYSFSILLAFVVAGCNAKGSSQNSNQPSANESTSAQTTTSENNNSTSNNASTSANGATSTSATPSSSSSTATSSSATPSSSSSSSQSSGSSYVPDASDKTIYQITESTLSNGTYDATADEYTFTVSGSYKQIYVNLPEKTLTVELNGVTLTNSENSPIYVESCEGIDLSAKKNTTNVVRDSRATYTQDVDGQGKGAIYVEDGDLKLKGTGTLNIYGNYLNGIHVKDDVKIQKLTLNVQAVNHGIRGNDSVTVTSGDINISCGGDGLHSENSDISSKGNQKGNVTINGGTVVINSWGDAIQAAYNAVIDQTDSSVPTTLTAKTNKYSTYSGETVDTSTNSFYLKMSSSLYSNGNYTYAAYINSQWYKATFKGTQTSGGEFGGGPRPGSNSTYYFYQLEKPAGATSFTLYRFQGSNVTTFSTSTYNAVGDSKAFNNAYDTVQIQSISNNKISFGSWSNYSSGGSNSNTAEVSAKGIKAENEIVINAGTIDVKAYDDAIHANNDGSLENGSTPLGNVSIKGGNLTLYASDDGVHADGTLNITGGTTNVTSSYEGLEGNIINVSGGTTYVYGTDDGVNATKGKSSPAINVSGGFLDVEVPTNGDTDGIDSNGTYTQTGGTVIVKGPGSASGGMAMAAALDTDGAVKITSGSLICFGAIEQTPNSSVTKTLCSSNTVSAGSHTISFSSSGTTYSTTLKSSSKGCVVYSSLGTATLK